MKKQKYIAVILMVIQCIMVCLPQYVYAQSPLEEFLSTEGATLGITDMTESNITTYDARAVDAEQQNVSVFSAGRNVYDSGVIINTAFYTDTEYVENILKGNLTFEVTVKNTSSELKSFSPIIAVYEDNEKLNKIRKGENIAVAASETEISSVTLYTESIPENAEVKAMVWNTDNMKPYINAITIQHTETDFYGNSEESAELINNAEKQISGAINNPDDTDWFRVTVPVSGTYSINSFSVSNIAASLYEENGDVVHSEAEYFDAELIAETIYYIKISGDESSYILTIDERRGEEFDIYEFDEDINIYKKSILDMCKENTSFSKQMYSEYETVLGEDMRLHALPAFLEGHPKNIENFDSLLNRYYGTKYDEFEALEKSYTDIIDKYTADENAEMVSIMSEEGNNVYPIGTKFYPKSYELPEAESADENEMELLSLLEPSLIIEETTETTITFNAVFPVSGAYGNSMYIGDFNTEDGILLWSNINNEIEMINGRYTISDLVPGGIYILELDWADENGMVGGENSIFRFVQLPNNTTETLRLYEGEKVAARMESADKSLASSADFNTWLERMDSVYNTYKELTGYTPFNSKKIEMKSTRSNLNEEMDITDGENYFWVVCGYYDYTRIFKFGRVYYQGLMKRLNEGDWGWIPIHEMGHVFDRDCWEFDSETMAQFKSYYVMEKLNAKIHDIAENEGVSWYTGAEYYNYLKHNRFMESYDYSFGNGIYASEGFAAILIDIQKEIGWNPFKKTFRYFGDLTSSQVPNTAGEKLKLFLTKLKDYSGKDVLNYISNKDKEIIESNFEIELGYTEPVYPSISGGGGSSSGSGTNINVQQGNYASYQFTPEASGNYYIYTSPYGGSGVSNDTFIEVYDNASFTGIPLASNDDYGGERFSKVLVSMTEGTTYYIKVRHYSSGQLHAELNITKNIPVQVLYEDGYEDVITATGEYAMFSFTPEISSTYIFEVTNYGGGTREGDTYIKLYENETLTKRIGHNEKKIIINLKAGHTYYLQFSGFLMTGTRGRINVRRGQILEFTKRTDSNFIYVNNPEFITQKEIIDEEGIDKTKIFEQKNVIGKNTYYQTHIVIVKDDVNTEIYPTDDFYMDVDFYNPNDDDVYITVENLAYMTLSSYGKNDEGDMRVLQNYISGGINLPTITIPAKAHILLFEQPLFSENNSQLKLLNYDYDRMCLMFDFTVSGGEITVSSLAAKNRENLMLEYGSEDVLVNGKMLGNGEMAVGMRVNETDLYDKYKGIARNQSNCIEANLEFAIDDCVESGNLQIYLQDPYYGELGVCGPRETWLSSVNPTYSGEYYIHYAMPENLHRFTYHYENTNRLWNFNFEHRNTNFIAETGNSVNEKVSDELLSRMKEDVAIGMSSFEESVDASAIGMGSWGVVYRYNITVANNGLKDRLLDFNVDSTNYLIVGSRMIGDTEYDFNYYPLNDGKKTASAVMLPKNSVTTFEIVTLYGLGDSSVWNELVLRDI